MYSYLICFSYRTIIIVVSRVIIYLTTIVVHSRDGEEIGIAHKVKSKPGSIPRQR